MSASRAVLFGLAVLIFLRIVIYTQFSVIWSDIDQVLVWASAREFLNFRFHEPCFWGQDYNSLLEGLFAAPLLWFGVPANLAVSGVTAVLCLAPLVFFVWQAAAAGRGLAALLALTYILSLPLRFNLLTGMARGFMPSVFFVGLAICLLKKLSAKLGSALFGLLMGLAVWIMPSAVVFGAPVTVYFLISKRLNPTFLVGLLLSLAWPAYVYWFYSIAHPEYLLYPSIELSSFDLNRLSSLTLNYAKYLSDLSPLSIDFIEFSVSFILVMLFLKQYRISVSFISALAIIFIALLNPKADNASDSIFYSYSRIFVGLPFLCAFLISELDLKAVSRKSAILFSIIFLMLSCRLFFGLEGDLAKETAIHNPVASMQVASLKKESREILELARANQQHGFVFYDLHRLAALTALSDDHDSGLKAFLFHDRRMWFMQEELPKVSRSLIFWGFDLSKFAKERAERLGYSVTVLNTDAFKLEKNNPSLSNRELFKELGVPIG